MGDLIGNVVDLNCILFRSQSFSRCRSQRSSNGRDCAYADMARLNVFYMIARAGVRAIGSSFSCLDILSYLYLAELDRERGDVFFV